MNPNPNHHHRQQQQQQQQQQWHNQQQMGTSSIPPYQNPPPQVPTTAQLGSGLAQPNPSTNTTVMMMREDHSHHLQEELVRTQEHNFDLTATVATLQAELTHTTRTMQQEAAQQRSKLEHELRLAQREAQRWKAVATSSTSLTSSSRSIVPSTSSTAFMDDATTTATERHVSSFPATSEYDTTTWTTGRRGMLFPPTVTVGSMDGTTTGTAAAAVLSTTAASVTAGGDEPSLTITNTVVPPHTLPEGELYGTIRDRRNGSDTIVVTNPVHRLVQNLLLLSPVRFDGQEGNNINDDDGDKRDRPTKGGHSSNLGGTHRNSEWSATIPAPAATANATIPTNTTASHIRQVLVGILAGTNLPTTSEDIHSLDGNNNGNNNNCRGWTESRLIDWLIRQTSSCLRSVSVPSTTTAPIPTATSGLSSNNVPPSMVVPPSETMTPAMPKTTKTTTTTTTTTIGAADRYCFLALLQSPAARQYVVETVGTVNDVESVHRPCSDTEMELDDSIKGELDRHGGDNLLSTAATISQTRHRGRISRIHPMELDGDDVGRSEQHPQHQQQPQQHLRYQQIQERIVQSMRNPWWIPSSHIAPSPRWDVCFSSSPNHQWTTLYQGWIRKLAMSQEPLHLRTLHLLLTEVRPKSNVTARDGGGVGRINYGSGSGGNSIWWDLCYPEISMTIQRIILHRRLVAIRSLDEERQNSTRPRNGKQQRSVPPRTSSSSSTLPGGRRRQGGGTVGGGRFHPPHQQDHVRRIGNVQRRLERLLLTVVPTVTTFTPSTRPTKGDGPTHYWSAQPGRQNFGGRQQEQGQKNLPNKTKPSRRNNNININAPSTTNRNQQGIGTDEEEEILALTLDIWGALIGVTPWTKVKEWCDDETGLVLPPDATVGSNNNGVADGSKSEKGGERRVTKSGCSHTFASLSPPPGGLYLVSLLLDFMEDLQFVHWEKSAMAASRVLSMGLTSSAPGNVGVALDDENEKSSRELSSDANDAIPIWYTSAIAVLVQIGKTEGGMQLLRTRLADEQRYDWTGNTLDVSIRQLHALALHWDDIQDGEIVRIGLPCNGDGVGTGDKTGRRLNEPLSRLERSVEGWIRLWHQTLLFIQRNEGLVKQPSQQISFRSLMLDLQDWYTSACAILLTSKETRPAIQSMIRLQLEELAMDEEEHDEMKRSL